MKRKDGSVDDQVLPTSSAPFCRQTLRETKSMTSKLICKRGPKRSLDYDWIGDARLIRRQVGKNRSTKEVADRLRRNKSDIENVLQALDEADLYLSEWVKKPGEYDLLQDGQQIFGDLPKAIAKKDANIQNASRAIAWSLYENRDRVTGRVYRFNAAFGKLAPQVLDIPDDQLELAANDKEDQVDDDDFARLSTMTAITKTIRLSSRHYGRRYQGRSDHHFDRGLRDRYRAGQRSEERRGGAQGTGAGQLQDNKRPRCKVLAGTPTCQPSSADWIDPQRLDKIEAAIQARQECRCQ